MYVYIQEMSLGPFTAYPRLSFPLFLVFGWLGGFSFYLILYHNKEFEREHQKRVFLLYVPHNRQVHFILKPAV